MFCSELFLLFQIFFVDKYFYTAEIIASHNFLNLKKSIDFSRVMNDRYLVNFDAWECFSGDLISGRFMRSAEGIDGNYPFPVTTK